MSNQRRSRRARSVCPALLAAIVWLAVAPPSVDADETAGKSEKKVVLLAGTVHQGPGGHPPGTHEYELTARLLAAALDKMPDVKVEVHFDGWPRDEKALDDADTIVVISDGADRNPADHPLLVGERLQVLGRQMERGCGLVAIHWSVFVPNDRGGPEFLEWIGGYFDYQSGPEPQKWFSKIQTAQTRPRPASPEHPVSRGLAPFDLREEYYYNIRFRENDPRLVPILSTPIPGEDKEQVVAWAVERENQGRGFGFTGGHFFENWGVPSFRRMVLNAILWTAHVEVPDGGAGSEQPPAADPPVAAEDEPISAVIVTGHQHPAHDWRATTAALQDVLGADRRFQLTVVTDPEFLATPNLQGYDVVVLNYCNWQRGGLSELAQANFQKYLRGGGGLSIIHFTNGAFHSSLPETPPSDWPEFRNICRRVWDHAGGQSSHDAYGRFTVHVTGEHPITAGLNSFETIDELYCNQQGDAPIDVLATARSTVTGRDEPMAFVYDYGKGRVFQTVLGHAAESIRTPGAATLIRRGTTWAARAPQRKVEPAPAEARHAAPRLAPEGKFGAALDPRQGVAWSKRRDVYDQRPLAVECFAKLDSKAGFNILAASAPKESAAHWEIYTYAGSGNFSLYMPGFEPAEIVSEVNIVDGAWHHVAAVFDETQARLFVDGKLVKETPIKRVRSGGPEGALYFGGYPPGGIGCDGLVDEVRISSVLRDIGTPTAPFAADEQTIGLWHFDRIERDEIEDASAGKNAAFGGNRATASPPLLTRRPADPTIRLRTIDTSPDESFLSLRLDTAGRLFAGGREGLFVYEPDGHGGYGPRQLLYRFPPDTWVTDVEIRGDDLYVMTNAALYLVEGGRLRREGLVPKRLLWGSPVDLHVTWHGLAWGPEGDLYFSSGDPLLNYGDFANRPDHWGHWTIYAADGSKTRYTGVGGFFRCRPDGSNFQVVAGGARGAVGIAFDRRWNLFGNDNDHESIAHRYSPARLLHVAPEAHFFWPRGWIAGMSPERSDLLDVVNTAMGREAPVGQAYYDDPLLGEKFADSVLVARWGQRLVSGYKLSPRGASFEAAEFPVLIGEDLARPVGVAVGRGGRIFASLSYMAGNEWSPKYPGEIVMLSPGDASASSFQGYEAASARPDKLWAELSQRSWSRRQAAHVELLRRGGNLLQDATRRLHLTADDDLSVPHLIWLSAVSGRPEALREIERFTVSGKAELRAAAIRALAEHRGLHPRREMFVAALRDEDPAVRHAAVVALFADDQPLPRELFTGPAGESDPYLRQAVAFLAARKATTDQLDELLKCSDPAQRLAGVLATGFRLTVPPPIGELPAELPLKYESGNAEFVIQYADDRVDLKQLGRTGSFTTAERWRALPHSEAENRCYQALLVRLGDEDDRVYEQAAYFLSLLDDAEANQQIAKTRRARTLQRLGQTPLATAARAWSIGPLADADGFKTVHPPESGAIDLNAPAAGVSGPVTWSETATNNSARFELLPQNAPASSYYYFRLQTLAPQEAAIAIRAPRGVKCWHNGKPLPADRPAICRLEAGSNDLLVRVEHDQSRGEVAIEFQTGEPVHFVLPEKIAAGSLAERLRSAGPSGSGEIPPEFLTVDWNAAVASGDVERGRKLFGTDALGCVKCHAVLPTQAGGGAPSLAEAAKRFTVSHLVESILAPSKQVAPVFGTTTIATVDGETLSGLVVEENNESLVLLLPTAARRSLAKSDIEARKLQPVSPMPTGLVKTPAELGDLLAYLLSANPAAP